MSTYWWINLGSLAVPLVFSFHPRLGFYRTWWALFPALLLPGLLFIAWDVVFTRMGVWGFNPDHLSGGYWLGLPVEEWLFFLAIPYACVFTYDSLKGLVRRDVLGPYAHRITRVLIAVLLVVGLAALGRWYTSVTFLLAALLLALHTFVWKSPYLGRFYLTYVVIFAFPFLIVNGMLTGLGLPEPVVWYNDAENLGLRVLTIPLEDFVYGLLLFLMNVTLYEHLLGRASRGGTVASRA